MSKCFRFGLLLAACVFAVLLSFCFTGSFDPAKMHSSFMVCLTVYAAIVAGYDFYHANNTREQSRRVDHAMRFLEQFDNPELRIARDKTRELRDQKGDITDNELKTMINNDQDIKRSIIYMFNYWEILYCSIKHKAVEEDMLKEYLSHIYISQYDRFKCWIEGYQKQHNPTGAKKLTELYNMWKV